MPITPFSALPVLDDASLPSIGFAAAWSIRWERFTGRLRRVAGAVSAAHSARVPF